MMYLQLQNGYFETTKPSNSNFAIFELDIEEGSQEAWMIGRFLKNKINAELNKDTKAETDAINEIYMAVYVFGTVKSKNEAKKILNI